MKPTSGNGAIDFFADLIARCLVVSVQAWATVVLLADGVGFEFRDRWTFWWAAAGLFCFCPLNRSETRVRMDGKK